MRRVRVEQLRPGDRLARPIYDDRGRVLLTAGLGLKASYITRLRELGMHFVYIVDDDAPDVIAPEIILPEVRAELVNKMIRVFEEAGRGGQLDMRTLQDVG